MGAMGSGMHANAMLPLQQRISSVDDLRPGSNCNSISKSQVRLMREMFEQQQQKANSTRSSSSNGEGVKGRSATTTSSNNTSSNTTSKYSTAEPQKENHSLNSMNNTNGSALGPEKEVEVLTKPPTIQACSGVLEVVSERKKNMGQRLIWIFFLFSGNVFRTNSN